MNESAHEEVAQLIRDITAEPAASASSEVAALLEQLQQAMATVAGLSAAATAAAGAVERDFAALQNFRRGLAAKVAEFEVCIGRRVRAINRFNAEVELLASFARRVVAAANQAVPVELPIPPAVSELVKSRPQLEHDIRRAAQPISGLTPLCGIYFLLHEGETVYVGQSTNVVARVGQHIADTRKAFDAWSYFACERDELADLERALISLLRPRLNVQYKPVPGEQSTWMFGAAHPDQGEEE